MADIHLQLRPGTDGALALGMMNVIINENLYDKEFVNHWTVGFEDLKQLVQTYSPENVEKNNQGTCCQNKGTAILFCHHETGSNSHNG